MLTAVATVTHEYRYELEKLYGPRLRGVFVFGSCSRGEQTKDSDIDLLVVLDAIDDYEAEINRTSELTSRLSLEVGFSISRVFLAVSDWERAEGPFLRNVRRDAIAA